MFKAIRKKELDTLIGKLNLTKRDLLREVNEERLMDLEDTVKFYFEIYEHELDDLFFADLLYTKEDKLLPSKLSGVKDNIESIAIVNSLMDGLMVTDLLRFEYFDLSLYETINLIKVINIIYKLYSYLFELRDEINLYPLFKIGSSSDSNDDSEKLKLDNVISLDRDTFTWTLKENNELLEMVTEGFNFMNKLCNIPLTLQYNILLVLHGLKDGE